jgi:Tfp pilus assembly protein PilO
MGPREIIFLVVLLVVPVASYFYVFKPRNQEIKQAQVEVENKQATLDKLREVTGQIEDLGMAIDHGRAAINLVEAKLPSARDVEVMLEDVWKHAAESRLTVKSVKSEKSVPLAGYMEQPLRVSMAGDFKGFYDFLIALENLPRITRIHEMTLDQTPSRRSGRDTGSGVMKADFVLSIYFEPTAEDTQ